jgi:DNA adenine methylase
MRKNRSIGPDGLLKSGMKIIGGKLGSTKDSGRSRMYKYAPENANVYLEPFLGSGNVLIGKPESEIELVNDLNPDVINFYKVMQAHPLKLYRMIEFLTGGMTEEYWQHMKVNKPTDPIEQAAWFYCLVKYANNGIVRYNQSGMCNSSFCKTLKGRGIYDPDWFELVYDRVKNVKFYNMPFDKFLLLFHAMFEPEKTWVVLDPPYSRVQTTYNGVYWTDNAHVVLRNTLENLNYRWLLTINDSEYVRELYKGFNIVSHNVHYGCSNTPSGRGPKPELIITNYPIELNVDDTGTISQEAVAGL